MHAELDPFPGLVPFHLLWDPNMSHHRSAGSLPDAYSVNVLDVGYFNTAGQFIVLFNLLLTKEENEKFLGFEFETTPFVHLSGVSRRWTVLRPHTKFHAFHDQKILLDTQSSNYNPNSDIQFRFKVVSGVTSGTGIALVGKLKHFSCDEGALSKHEDYFATQSIEWYRYARGKINGHLYNGDLVLITQCYKIPSWGYLTYFGEKGRKAKETWASFRPGGGDRGWKFEASQGLYAAEHLCIPEDPTSTKENGSLDQCIGFKAYSIHCDPKAWKELEGEHRHTLRR